MLESLSVILLTKVTDSNPRRKQVFSKTLVEQKRLGRTLPAVINGFSVSLARANGLIEDSSASSTNSPPTMTNDESLFLSDGSSDNESRSESKPKEPQPVTNAATTTPVFNPFAKPFDPVPASNPFQTAGASSAAKPFTSVFAVPPGTLNTSSVFGQPSAPTALANHSPTLPLTQPAPLFPQTAKEPKFSFGIPSFTGNDISKTTLLPLTSLSDSNTLPTSSRSLPGATNIFSTSGLKSTPSFTSFLGKSNLTTDQPANATDQNQSLTPDISPGDLAKTSFNPFKAQPASFQFPTPLAKFEAPAAFPPAQTLTPIQPSQAPFPFVSQQTNFAVSDPKSPDHLSGQSSALFAGTPVGNTFIPPSFLILPQPSFTPKPVIDNPTFLSNPSPKPQLGEIPDPLNLSTPPNTFFSKNSDTSNTLSTSHSTINQTKIGPPKPDPRPQLLDLLAEEIICENHGLLQQFLHYTISPVVVKAITQVQKERIQAEIGW